MASVRCIDLLSVSDVSNSLWVYIMERGLWCVVHLTAFISREGIG